MDKYEAAYKFLAEECKLGGSVRVETLKKAWHGWTRKTGWNANRRNARYDLLRNAILGVYGLEMDEDRCIVGLSLIDPPAELEYGDVEEFVKEMCEMSPTTLTRKSRICNAYRLWCYTKKLLPESNVKLGWSFASMGVWTDTTGKFYQGIRLRPFPK